MMNHREKMGLILGLLMGPFTATISFIRRSRMFHPRGMIFTASVTASGGLTFPPHVLVRFSSAWWKQVEWVDVLGVALRFSDSPRFGPDPQAKDQDLLFATIRHPWTLPFAPFTTKFRNFLDNSYYAVSPFEISERENERYEFKLVPDPHLPGSESASRTERLERAVAQDAARFSLRWRRLSPAASSWEEVAALRDLRPAELDQEKLRFNPFQSGMGIRPRGLIHALRIGAYGFSQKARALRQKN